MCVCPPALLRGRKLHREIHTEAQCTTLKKDYKFAADAAEAQTDVGDPFDFWVQALITTLIRGGISEGAKIVRDLINNKPNITHEEILRELRDKITISESLVAVVTRGNAETIAIIADVLLMGEPCQMQ